MAGKVLELKRWERVTYYPEGLDKEGRPRGEIEVTMELRRLRRHEARELRGVILSAFDDSAKDAEAAAAEGELPVARKAEIVGSIWDRVPEEKLRQIFADYVRDVQGLVIDNVPVTTGAQLLEDVDHSLMLFVLFGLQNLAGLTPAETFRSASRSTSSVDAARLPASPGSDAASTDVAAGPPPSDATAPPAVESTPSAEVEAAEVR